MNVIPDGALHAHKNHMDTPAETGGQAQGVQTKKERTEYNNESEENGKA